MISFQEAEKIVLATAQPLPTELVSLSDSLHRVLAREVVADMPMPPFDKSMVDGYACRRADLGQALQVVETIAAGYPPKQNVGTGQCAKIMTGAMVPGGVDCVFMVENSKELGEGLVRFTGDKTGDNIVPKGLDIKGDEVLLKPGHRIEAADVAVLAGAGCVRPKVFKVPRVGVVATGDELVEPSVKPGTGQIRNSNAYQLCAQLQAMGMRYSYEGIARDNEASINEHLETAIDRNDVILFSGGVSMGEFDLVPGVLEAHGVKLLFDKVAIQPGKPTVFGHSDEVYCFGLPGNPVASFVVFTLLVRPFLLRLMGCNYTPPIIQMPLNETFRRKSPTREAWVPVVLTKDGRVARVDYHGSAHVNALSGIDGLTRFPQGVTEMEAGSLASVRLIRL